MTSTANPLKQLTALGGSPWIDFIGRDAIRSGKLAGWIDEGLRGMTSNPTIFETAIGGGRAYDDDLRALARRGASAAEMADAVAVADVQLAADVLRGVYDGSDGLDGFVSIEVSPRFAHDTAATVAHARALASAVARPNVMIKVPATVQGLPAITELLGDGIPVNVTLLFGVRRYAQVIAAYLAGLEARITAGHRIDGLVSVASLFLSRIDARVDPRLGTAADLRGHAAIACAKLAYQDYQVAFAGHRFARLKRAGAHPQRLLWASTGTKDPAYRDVMYAEALVGADTVTTMPLDTFEAFRDHGNVAPTLGHGVAEARRVVRRLAELGIDLEREAEVLEADGVARFQRSYDTLLQLLERRRRQVA